MNASATTTGAERIGDVLLSVARHRRSITALRTGGRGDRRVRHGRRSRPDEHHRRRRRGRDPRRGAGCEPAARRRPVGGVRHGCVARSRSPSGRTASRGAPRPKDAAALVALVAAGATLADPGWSAAPTDVRFVAPGGSAAGPPIVPVAVVSLATPAVRSVQVLGLVRSGGRAGRGGVARLRAGAVGWPARHVAVRRLADPTDEPWPAARRARIGAGVTIALFDTGVPAAASGHGAGQPRRALATSTSRITTATYIVDLPYGGPHVGGGLGDRHAGSRRPWSWPTGSWTRNVATDVTATERISEAMQEVRASPASAGPTSSSPRSAHRRATACHRSACR